MVRHPESILGLALAGVLALSCSSDSTGADGDDGSGGADAGFGGPVGGASGSGGTSSGGSSTGGSSSGGSPQLDAGSPGLDGSVPAIDGVTVGAGPNVDRTNPDLYEFVLDPSALDPSATNYIEDQYAQLDTRAEPLGKLVFFLPGATNIPRDWRDHGRKLAEFGFHVVIPHYDNAWGDACAGQGGSCNTDTRWEALVGEDTSSVVDIARPDSAEERVLVMLAHLATAHPEGDWGYYLQSDGSLRDDQVIMAGISHGATSTGLFATRRAFWRAVMHSGGYWSGGETTATPISDHYGLSHTDDPQHSGHLSAWQSAGLLGSPTSIDDQSAPFGDARQLITSEPNTYPHCSVVVHSSSPTDSSGNYLFEPAWRYMYGVDSLPE